MVLATPLASKVSVVAPSVAPLVASVAVAPLTVVAAEVHGLLLLAHIVASCVVTKAEIDQLWREEEETEVPLWAQR